jgi:hypothetical protein
MLAQVGVVSGGFALFLAFKFFTYGTLLPHAFALKTITQLYAPQPMALWEVWRKWAWALLLAGGVGLLLVPRRSESLALIVYCAASAASLVLGPMGDWARYSAHLLPIVAMLASVPLAIVLRLVPVLALAACSLIGWQSYASFEEFRGFIATAAGHQACRKQIGEYLERRLPPGTPVLSSDIGGIAYAAPSIKFIDGVGLTSKDMLEARARGKSVDSVLLTSKPLFIADTCGGTCTTPQDFSVYGWLSNPSYWLTPLADHEYLSRLHNGALLDRCRSPDGGSFGVARFQLSAAKSDAP